MAASLLSVIRSGRRLLPITKQALSNSRTAVAYQPHPFDPHSIHKELPPGYHVAEGEDVFTLPEDQHVDHLAHDVELTDELRAKLAAKYNMRPEDYIPMNQGAMAIGDYPTLPYENVLARDYNYDWDDPHSRRNYGEPVLYDHNDYNAVFGLETRPYIYDDVRQFKFLFYGVVVIFGGIILGEIFPRIPGQTGEVAPYQYPWKDCKDVLTKDENGKNIFREPYRVVEHTFPKTAADYAGRPHH